MQSCRTLPIGARSVPTPYVRVSSRSASLRRVRTNFMVRWTRSGDGLTSAWRLRLWGQPEFRPCLIQPDCACLQGETVDLYSNGVFDCK